VLPLRREAKETRHVGARSRDADRQPPDDAFAKNRDIDNLGGSIR
jgi:hypothetical protein